ncbi:MAG TPA: ABC transporter ATP-binding protein [Pyrinomonadaceae bacterium]|nr:ABC transporter ATP-binding protein [Pyrinomonadaceae bacterium]
MSESILQTEALTKRYGSRTAVDRVSLSVQRGDIFGFLGQNGAGKSTVIRMALGLVRPSSGRVLLFGHDMSSHPLRALGRIGAIVESPAFYENFSGFDNVRMLAALSGGASRPHINETLALVGLSKRANDQVRKYSHGMRQRLAIAQALLPRPEFIILDEPTDGLDAHGIQEIRRLLPRLRDELGLTIMLSSHLLHEVERVCNRIAIIDHGQLLYEGGVENLFSSDRVLKITAEPLEHAYNLLQRVSELSVSRNGSNSLYLKLPHESIPRVNAMLVENGIRVTELSPHTETLEEIFLRLTSSN